MIYIQLTLFEGLKANIAWFINIYSAKLCDYIYWQVIFQNSVYH